MDALERWDRRFLDLAKQVSTWSKDPSTQVGAILVNEYRQIVGTGYNGLPRGVTDAPERLHDRATKYAMTVHAEANALMLAGTRARGATLYVYPGFPEPFMCAECCKLAIQAGVSGIVGYGIYHPLNLLVQRWQESNRYSGIMWKEAGKWVRSYPEGA